MTFPANSGIGASAPDRVPSGDLLSKVGKPPMPRNTQSTIMRARRTMGDSTDNPTAMVSQ
jgi:hypothetical protein